MSWCAFRLAFWVALSQCLLLYVAGKDPRVQPKYETTDLQNHSFHSSVVVRQGRSIVNLGELAKEQANMTWSVEDKVGGTTYSVIVVEWRHHPSNLFRDQQRVQAYMSGGTVGNVVTSVQFASPLPRTSYDGESQAPFFARHPEGVDKRVRIVHATDLVEAGGVLDEQQVSHLRAACEDPSETTILVMVDETCQRRELPAGVPSACASSIARIYPFNTESSDDSNNRNAYTPLGPRDTFSFVRPSKLGLTSQRQLLFNLEVTAGTSIRRDKVIAITRHFVRKNPTVPCKAQDGKMSARRWQELLLDSKFTITPGGHNAETFRMWEALEAGSIPIVFKRDYTDPAYNAPDNCGIGDISWNTVAASPFAREVSVSDWHQIPSLLDRLQQEPDEYIDKLQADCMAWYSAVMAETYTSMLQFGTGHDMFPQAGPIVDDVQYS